MHNLKKVIVCERNTATGWSRYYKYITRQLNNAMLESLDNLLLPVASHCTMQWKARSSKTAQCWPISKMQCTKVHFKLKNNFHCTHLVKLQRIDVLQSVPEQIFATDCKSFVSQKSFVTVLLVELSTTNQVLGHCKAHPLYSNAILSDSGHHCPGCYHFKMIEFGWDH